MSSILYRQRVPLTSSERLASLADYNNVINETENAEYLVDNRIVYNTHQ